MTVRVQREEFDAAAEARALVGDRTDIGGIVTFTVNGMSAGQVKEQFAARTRRINVTISTRDSAVIDFAARALDTVVRSSVHYFLSDADLVEFAGVVRALRC